MPPLPSSVPGPSSARASDEAPGPVGRWSPLGAGGPAVDGRCTPGVRARPRTCAARCRRAAIPSVASASREVRACRCNGVRTVTHDRRWRRGSHGIGKAASRTEIGRRSGGRHRDVGRPRPRSRGPGDRRGPAGARSSVLESSVTRGVVGWLLARQATDGWRSTMVLVGKCGRHRSNRARRARSGPSDALRRDTSRDGVFGAGLGQPGGSVAGASGRRTIQEPSCPSARSASPTPTSASSGVTANPGTGASSAAPGCSSARCRPRSRPAAGPRPTGPARACGRRTSPSTPRARWRRGWSCCSKSGTIEGRMTGARQRCTSIGCPGWFVAVTWESGQALKACSAGLALRRRRPR